MSVHSSLGMLLLSAMVSLYWLAAPSSAPAPVKTEPAADPRGWTGSPETA
jgi:hypothetical protein